jgi:YidC/Oxa1 family membrane protein insertase
MFCCLGWWFIAGCLPSLATIPIFIGLYRSLTNVATEGLLDTQGFYWIPTLAGTAVNVGVATFHEHCRPFWCSGVCSHWTAADDICLTCSVCVCVCVLHIATGPTTIAARQAGSGTEWLYPFVEGAPPIGWHDARAYLVLPVLLILCQYVSSSIISPPIDPNAENANTQRVLYTFLPLMVGFFSLNVPSGLGLYYLSNTVMSTLIQVWLRKLGGADVQINELGPITKVGTGRRMGPVATDDDVWTPSAAFAASIAADAAAAEAAAAAAAGGGAQAVAVAELQEQQAAAASAATDSSSSSSSSLPSPGMRWARRKRTVAAAPSSA